MEDNQILFPVKCGVCGLEIIIDIKDNTKQEVSDHLQACLGKLNYPQAKKVLSHIKILQFSEITKEELDCIKQGSFLIDYKKREVIIRMIG